MKIINNIYQKTPKEKKLVKRIAVMEKHLLEKEACHDRLFDHFIKLKNDLTRQKNEYEKCYLSKLSAFFEINELQSKLKDQITKNNELTRCLVDTERYYAGIISAANPAS